MEPEYKVGDLVTLTDDYPGTVFKVTATQVHGPPVNNLKPQVTYTLYPETPITTRIEDKDHKVSHLHQYPEDKVAMT